MNIILTTSNIRIEERCIITALDAAACEYEIVDVRKKIFDRQKEITSSPSIVFNRCISQVQSLATVRYYESLGISCVNSAETIAACGDKQATTLRLQAAGVPTPRTVFALGRESALRAIEQLGMPVVIKPVVGSWGRMVVRVNDLDGAESVIELRENLQGSQHRLHYIQKFIDTGNRDIRVIAIDGEILTAYARKSDRWITNAARGARGEPCAVPPELERICRLASDVMGGGILSFDVFEVEDEGFLLNEVNHTTEFALAAQVTGIDIAGELVKYLKLRLAEWSR
ncbi:lysine biosynthesis protein LysX [Consotaella aegiceratis]|uniref:lysine biosynthesis protein LysX n=1 Tax=Consotaella aegiceratis TaxID=3097961 RepID=UPI002F3FF710